MKEISILSQLDAHLLFSVPNQPAFFCCLCRRLNASTTFPLNGLRNISPTRPIPPTASTCWRTAAFATM